MSGSAKRVPRVSVTGTKGKTTTVSVIAEVLQKLNHNVLKVDTTGHFINGKRKSDLESSKALWGLVPSVSPGRYLYEFYENPEFQERGVAVLECSVGCSNLPGLGYSHHTVGIFLNVYEDHLGSSERLKTKEDILNAKSFIYRKIRRNGWAVFNADDELVVHGLKAVPDFYPVNILPFGINFKNFNLENHLKNEGVAVTVRDNYVAILKDKQVKKVIALKDLQWTFNGEYIPSVYNILASVAGLYGVLEGKLPTNFTQILQTIRLDRYSGRLTLLQNKQNIRILADYAHEKISLREVSKLARKLSAENGRVIGVVRLADDRTEELIKDTGHYIANDFDSFIVYDKIDGYWRKPRQPGHSRKFVHQVVGRISKLFAEAIAEKNSNVTRILREDKALEQAAKEARPGDVVVVIVNDNIERSINFIKDSFKADFA
jgi:cyanophycin synthetase